MNRSIPAFLLGLTAFATVAVAEHVDQFTLEDQHGATHNLEWLADKSAIVIMIQGNGCPIVRNAWPTYRELRDTYQNEGVEFLMLNSNLQDNAASIERESAMFQMDIPILVDETQAVGESLKLIRTAEVLVIDPESWEIVYRGPVDDRLTYEKQKPFATENYLRDALDAVLAGAPIEVPVRDALGCLINFPNRQPSI
jgi:thiol-disulfide isomerase/thioredoxin